MPLDSNTVRHEFVRFMAAVHPQGVSSIQFSEMETAFFGGASAVFFILTEAISAPNVSAESAFALFQKINQEVSEFAEQKRRLGAQQQPS